MLVLGLVNTVSIVAIDLKSVLGPGVVLAPI